jgi:dUTP pyrophosphatase
MKRYGCIEVGKLKADIGPHVANIISVKRVKDNAILPSRGSEDAAGWDLYAAIDEPICIAPHTTVKIGTGFAFELPLFTFGAIFPRSGLATKQGLRPANCVGVCDSDYRGEYIVAVHNDSESIQWVEPGERIAQLIILPYVPIVFNEVNELTDTERGDGGFGSTGKK